MALPLRGIDINLVEQRLAHGHYAGLTIGPEKRRFTCVQPFVGYRWSVVTTEQHKIHFLSLKLSEHCQWCRCQVKPQDALGIPVDIIHKGDETFVAVHMTTCSFECTAAILHRELGWPLSSRSPHYHQSWKLLNLLFTWMHPSKRLVPAPDYTIFDANDKSVIEANKSTFIPVMGLVKVNLPLTYQLIPAMP